MNRTKIILIITLIIFKRSGENMQDTLAHIRKHKYMKMISVLKKGLQPERLPPTENAIKYHSYRVHLQILKWMGVDLDELKWGWRKENKILVPVKTDMVCFTNITNLSF